MDETRKAYNEALGRLSPEALAHIEQQVAEAPEIVGERLDHLLSLWDVPAPNRQTPAA